MTPPKHTDESLAELVRQLTDAVKLLAERFRRKRISDAVLAVVVACIVGFIAYYILVIRPGGKAQIHNLACYAVRLRPEGYSETSDALRAKYHCPPFDPADLPTDAPTPTSTSTATRTVPGPRTTVTPAPRADATRTVIVHQPGPISTSTAVRTRRVPGPTRTVTHTVHATVTVTRGPCVAGILLC